MQIKLCSVAAVALNNVIGVNNNLPWKLPSDLRWFKQLTKDHVIIMGRNTWESLPRKPLPHRYNVVITSNPPAEEYKDTIFVDPKSALSLAMFEARRRRQDKVFVIGGASIYNMFKDVIDEHYITSVICRPDGDTFYPQIDFSKFDQHILLDTPFPGDDDEFPFQIFHYIRKTL